MDWKIISSRRKFSLETYLSGVLTEEEALKKFESHGITNFPLEEVRKILDQKKAPVQQETSLNVSNPVVETETAVDSLNEDIVLPKKSKKSKFFPEE